MNSNLGFSQRLRVVSSDSGVETSYDLDIPLSSPIKELSSLEIARAQLRIPDDFPLPADYFDFLLEDDEHDLPRRSVGSEYVYSSDSPPSSLSTASSTSPPPILSSTLDESVAIFPNTMYNNPSGSFRFGYNNQQSGSPSLYDNVGFNHQPRYNVPPVNATYVGCVGYVFVVPEVVQQVKQPRVYPERNCRPKDRRTPKKNAKAVCNFCVNNEDKDGHDHLMKDKNGLVVCPKLYRIVCPHCGATGPLAHTIRHCPERERESRRKIEADLKEMSDRKKQHPDQE